MTSALVMMLYASSAALLPPSPATAPAPVPTHVRVAVDPTQRHVLAPANEPLRHTTLAHGYTLLVSQRTGMRFREQLHPSHDAAIAAVCAGEADIMLLMGPLAAPPCPGLVVSRAYYRGHTLLATRIGVHAPAQLEQLDGRRLAIVQGSRYESWLLSHHPQVQAMPMPDLHSALAAVEQGVAEAALGLDVVMRPMVRRDFAQTLEVDADGVDLPATLHLAVRADNRALLERIESTLASISAAEHARLMRNWAQRSYFGPPSAARLARHYRWELLAAAGLFVLLTGMALWLHRAQRSAQRSERQQARFIGMMSHDLRNATQALVVSVDLLGQSQLDPGQRRLVDAAGAAGEGLRSLLSHALDYSRLAAGAFVPAPEACNVAGLLQQCTDAVRPAIAAKALTLSLHLPSPVLPLLWVDALALRQIVNNLLGNALKFTLSGRIDVSASLRRIDHRLELVIVVADTGIGIAADKQARVFEAFCQAHDTHSRALGGSGLGLSICRDIAQALGGEITLRSEVGRGSRFSVRLPVTLAEPPNAGADAQAPLAGQSVLLVEDHLINRAVVTEQLMALGATVTAVGEGCTALASFAAVPSSVVLLDCGLADISGYQVARALREIEQRLARTPARIVAVSATFSPEHTRQCRDAGMDAVLCKPLEIRQLLEALELHDPGPGLRTEPPALLAARYLRSVREDADALRWALGARRINPIRYRAHRLAGALRQMGQAHAAEIADDLQALDIDDPALWNEVERLLGYLLLEIERFAAEAITSTAADSAPKEHARESRSTPGPCC